MSGDQLYDRPPLAVSNCDSPEQIELKLGLTDTDGAEYVVILM